MFQSRVEIPQHEVCLTHSCRRHARAVLVDMEPKVINRAIVSAAHSATNWCYPPNSSFSQQSGSGNNWARGYNSYGPKFASTVCELVRREVNLALASDAAKQSI